MNENFTINPVPAPPDTELLKAFENVPTSHISDNLRRLEGVLGLRRFHRSRKLIGTAVTVKLRAGTTLDLQGVVDDVPGHVIVVAPVAPQATPSSAPLLLIKQSARRFRLERHPRPPRFADAISLPARDVTIAARQDRTGAITYGQPRGQVIQPHVWSATKWIVVFSFRDRAPDWGRSALGGG